MLSALLTTREATGEFSARERFNVDLKNTLAAGWKEQ